jgi:hypothetical protein
MPGSSKDAHSLVPSRMDGIAIKIVEMRNPIPIAMLSILFMIRDRVMKMTNVVALIDAANPVPAVRGPYKKTAEISRPRFKR